jgi:hypothetical protein
MVEAVRDHWIIAVGTIVLLLSGLVWWCAPRRRS